MRLTVQEGEEKLNGRFLFLEELRAGMNSFLAASSQARPSDPIWPAVANCSERLISRKLAAANLLRARLAQRMAALCKKRVDIASHANARARAGTARCIFLGELTNEDAASSGQYCCRMASERERAMSPIRIEVEERRNFLEKIRKNCHDRMKNLFASKYIIFLYFWSLIRNIGTQWPSISWLCSSPHE